MAAPAREPAAAPDLVGRRVGRFDIRSVIGCGGMGEVYLAEDTVLHREVALKRLSPRWRADPEARGRILKEAQRTSALNSPHIASVHDVIESGEELLLVMEYVEGKSLRHKMRAAGALPVSQFLEIAVQCAEALAAAHEHHLIHRDIKPENIMLTADGRVKVLDFGLARQVQVVDESSSTASLPTTSNYAGTPGYMAPEVLLEEEVDARCDIFSLGIVFYEMLAGEHPFRTQKVVATADRILHAEVKPLHKVVSGCPPELERIVSKMLAKDPAVRYATAADLLVDLRSLQRGEPPLPRPIRRLLRKSWVRWSAAAAAAVLIALLGLLVWTRWPRSVPFAERDWVLISDFDNSTDDAVFDRTLNEALTISLQQSSYVNVLPRDRVFAALKRMERQDISRLEEPLAREVCQRENARLLLTGTILRSGESYQIRVRGEDPASGRTIFVEDQRFRRKEELFASVDGLTTRVRRRLGESVHSIEKSSHPLHKVTTKSLEALQLYSRASDDLARNQVESAAARLQAALVLDPDFAMAHYRSSIVYQIFGNRQKEIDELGRAYELAARLTDRERYFIEAAYFGLHGREKEQIDRLEALVGLYPDDAEAHFELAMMHSTYDRSDKAIAELREVIRLNPYLADAYGALVIRLAYVNATDPAMQVYSEAVRRNLRTAKLEWGHGMALLGGDRVDEALRVFAAFDQDPAYGNIGRLYAARAEMYQGKFAVAAARLERDLLADIRAGNRSPEVVRRYLLARSYLFLGRKRDAVQQLNLIESRGQPRDLQGRELRWAGAEYARMGDLQGAKRVAARLDALNADHVDTYNKAAALSLRADIEMAEGRVSEAVQSYQQALLVMPWAWAHAGLAQAYFQQRNWADARDARLKVIEAKGQILRHDCSSDWVLAHLELARTYRQLGDRGKATQYYEHFLKLWAQSDALPLLEIARRERQAAAMNSQH